MSEAGKIFRREFARETKNYYHEENGNRSRKEIWHPNIVEALKARVELCDLRSAQAAQRAKYWADAAKSAFVLQVQHQAGRFEYEYDESVGAGAAGGAGGGDREGQGAEAQEAASAQDDRTGGIG